MHIGGHTWEDGKGRQAYTGGWYGAEGIHGRVVKGGGGRRVCVINCTLTQGINLKTSCWSWREYQKERKVGRLAVRRQWCLVITFLGMELNTRRSMVMRLPEERLKALKRMLREWRGMKSCTRRENVKGMARGMKSCTRRELESIVGHLRFASRAVRPGRAFMRRLVDLGTTVKQRDRRVRLNLSARADLEW